MERDLGSLRALAEDDEEQEEVDKEEYMDHVSDVDDAIQAFDISTASDIMVKMRCLNVDELEPSTQRDMEIERESILNSLRRLWTGDTVEGSCKYCDFEGSVDAKTGACAVCMGTNFHQCYYCKEPQHVSQVSEERDHILCDECAAHVHVCDRCGDLFDDRTDSWESSMDLCTPCAVRTHLREYNWKRPLSRDDFKSTGHDDNNPLFLGVEAEVDDGHGFGEAVSKLNEVNSHINLWDLVQDGSLGDTGFEIVSIPATLSFHIHRFPWEEIFEICRSNGYGSDQVRSCGLHVHVSKDRIPIKALKKVNLFVAANPGFMQQLARRKDTRGYAKFKSLREAREDGPHSKERYEAVNFATRGQDTVEFRLFQGTIKPEVLYASLEVVDAIIQFCCKHSEEHATEHGEDLFRSFVDDADKYNYIHNLLN